jgi:hypothetical protein
VFVGGGVEREEGGGVDAAVVGAFLWVLARVMKGRDEYMAWC